MQISQLRQALEIEACGSITAAARKLYISQPNLSKGLRELEEELGADLFIRTTQGIHPTPAGKIFLQSAKDILQKLDNLKEGIQSEKEPKLNILYSPYLNPPNLTESLKSLGSRWEVTVKQAGTQEAVQQVAVLEADVAFLCYPAVYEKFFQQQFMQNQITCQTLAKGKYKLLLSRESPLLKVDVAQEILSDYIQVVMDWDFPSLSARQKKDAPSFTASQRMVRAGCQEDGLSILKEIKNGYMLHPAADRGRLKRYGLVEQNRWLGEEYNIAAIYGSGKTTPSLKVLELIESYRLNS